MSSSVSATLVAQRDRLLRSGTAERVADILREQISGGLFPPGQRLSEESISEALGVSRNTLREAFRLLGHERLVVHELNRGVFVRVLTAADVADLYWLREVIEVAALHQVPATADFAAIRTGLERAEIAAAAGNWAGVATEDIRFHQELVALAGSVRMDEVMGRSLAELRLAFHVVSDPRDFFAPYVARNRRLVELLHSGQIDAAERELRDYLAGARGQLVNAFGSVR
jgi:DNA-binding GntR family transcriptional regulator